MNTSNNNSLEQLRHSCSHVMARAVLELFPGTKLAIGPSIADGFYYDFYPSKPFQPDDLPRIEKRMKEIIGNDEPFVQEFKDRTEAAALLNDEPFKTELLRDISDQKISFYRLGSFIDLCRGPHVARAGVLKHYKLLSLAAAYWRGDEKRESLQRIYGTVFETQEELDAYLKRREDAKKRDHRILGRQMDLFSIQEDAGAGLVFWHPKGALIRHIIETFWKEEHLKRGYQLLNIPHIAHRDLWKISGHLDFYKENMYSPITVDNQQYILKPMNCPGHILIYKSKLHSYREMPIQYAELGTVYRYERSGVLHGLMRVRGFTQDDAHVFCRQDQLEEEILRVIDFTVTILKTFGFANYEIMLSTRPEQFVGTTEGWDTAESALQKALRSAGLSYKEDPGAGVFYGPKIDIKIKDSLDRLWQCSTIQVDFNIPERFDVSFRNSHGSSERVCMIHRALMGSLERFFGVLIEHYNGLFPLWLNPLQAVIIPVTSAQDSYAREVAARFGDADLRIETDLRNEKVGFKIREAIIQKIPFQIVVGKKEASNHTVSVRDCSGTDYGMVPLPDLIDQLMALVSSKSGAFNLNFNTKKPVDR
ncbi:MAG: threonine--tRNA ligase [Elusimicrobia bacterium]|nr:threonine--tRNA ligase [Elusimicrobiota bacterium]MBD3412145.1 threonine--tRNA ligase [Elusimicrobiota bacterium]